MSRFLRAVLAGVMCFASIVGPIGAATNGTKMIAQAPNSSGTISGTIVDSNGRTVAGATVTANGGGGHFSTKTDAGGGFSLTLPAAIYTVSVSKGGYQPAQQDIVIAGGDTIKANITLVVASLNNLSVIGRVTATSGRNAATFNTSSNAAPSVGVETIRERNVPDLSQIVQTIPGVTITNSATNVNHQFVIHGLSTETRITLDGHPVSTGISGQFITNYAGSGLFSGIDTYQGAAIGPPTAGTSGSGIVNLRTPDFGKDGGYVLGGLDQYGGSQYTLIANANALDNRVQVVLGKSFSGYNGPSKGVIADDIDTAESPSFPNNPATLLAPHLGQYPLTGNYTVPTLGAGLAPAYTVASATDFSNTYSLNAQVAKIRYNFSSATSLAFEFLGLQGRYDPQGNAYGQIAGYETLPECGNKVTTPAKITYYAAGNGAQCGLTSIYNAPWTASQIGQNVALYQFYPGSDVRENEPNFNLDFKTTIGGNDTLLFRPYTANIDRFIDGSGEAAVPGNDGNWSIVTNTANCVVTYTAPTVKAGGAKGPCFSTNAANGSIAYVTGNTTAFGTLFPFQTSSLPNGGAGCSLALPCYTTTTAQAQSGLTGYGTPYSTFEFDKLNGYTFTYIHPIKQNTLSLTFDHYLDDTFGLFNDTSPIPAGCTYVQPTGATNTVAGAGPSGPGYGYQPTCPLGYLPYSPISTPETASSVSSLSLTSQLQLTPQLEFDIGSYFNMTKILGQVEDQSLVTTALAAGAKSGSVAIALVPSTVFFSHYDPHFGLIFRPLRDLSIRATGGSSQTLPYANQLSGFTKVNQGASSTTLTTPNANLIPEEAVDYDLGLDYRTPHGSVFSGDIWNYTIHNPFLTTVNIVPPGSALAAGFAGENTGLLLQSTTTNAQQLYSQGFQIAYKDEPRVGFGYYVNATFNRVYYLGLPASYFSSLQYPYNGEQLNGAPYAKAYGEFRQVWRNGGLLRMGFDYEGNNNSNNYSPYILTDLTISEPVGYGVMLSVTGQNIFNTNFGNGIARSVEYQGNAPIGAAIEDGQFVYGIKNAQYGIIGPPPQTFYFTLSKTF